LTEYSHIDKLSLTSDSLPERIKTLAWIGESYILGTIGKKTERGKCPGVRTDHV
jgi:hypothetical protein